MLPTGFSTTIEIMTRWLIGCCETLIDSAVRILGIDLLLDHQSEPNNQDHRVFRGGGGERDNRYGPTELQNIR